jgi:hypothetical protein
VSSKVESDLAALNQALRAEASRDDCDDLHRALTSLRYVLRFLGDHVSGDAAAPLRRLHAALTDVEAGGRHAMLERDRKAGRPSGLIEYELRGMLAGALDLLVRAGMTPASGAEWLCSELRHAGLPRDEVRPGQIKSWRMKASALEGPQASIEMLERLRRRHDAIASLAEAQRIAGLIVEVVARYWTTSETPMLGES